MSRAGTATAAEAWLCLLWKCQRELKWCVNMCCLFVNNKIGHTTVWRPYCPAREAALLQQTVFLFNVWTFFFPRTFFLILFLFENSPFSSVSRQTHGFETSGWFDHFRVLPRCSLRKSDAHCEYEYRKPFWSLVFFNSCVVLSHRFKCPAMRLTAQRFGPAVPPDIVNMHLDMKICYRVVYNFTWIKKRTIIRQLELLHSCLISNAVLMFSVFMSYRNRVSLYSNITAKTAMFSCRSTFLSFSSLILFCQVRLNKVHI